MIFEKVEHTLCHMFFLVEVQCSCLRTIPAGSGQYPRLLISGTVRCTPKKHETDNIMFKDCNTPNSIDVYTSKAHGLFLHILRVSHTRYII